MAETMPYVGTWPPDARPAPTLRSVEFDHDEPATQDVQAAAEGVVESDGDYVEFFGDHFRLAERVSMMPLLAFANASKQGVDSADMKGLAAMYAMIRGVIHRPPMFDDHGVRVIDETTGRPARDESEWNRFEELAIDEAADDRDIMGFVNRAMEVMSGRPTAPREISSDGSRPTSDRSKASSSSPGMPREADGLVAVRDVGR